MNLRVKIGDAQFEGSGEDYENVAADYSKWMAEITRQERRKITDAIAKLETDLRYERKRLQEFDRSNKK